MDDRMAAIGRLQKKVSGDKKPGSLGEAVGRAAVRALDGKGPSAFKRAEYKAGGVEYAAKASINDVGRASRKRKGATGLRGANPVGTATSAARTAAKAAGRVASVGRPAPKGSAPRAVLG